MEYRIWLIIAVYLLFSYTIGRYFILWVDPTLKPKQEWEDDRILMFISGLVYILTPAYIPIMLVVTIFQYTLWKPFEWLVVSLGRWSSK